MGGKRLLWSVRVVCIGKRVDDVVVADGLV